MYKSNKKIHKINFENKIKKFELAGEMFENLNGNKFNP